MERDRIWLLRRQRQAGMDATDQRGWTCWEARGPECEGWDRNWGLVPCQPRAHVPTSPVWAASARRRPSQPDQPRQSVPTSPVCAAGPQKVRVGTETGGWTPANHVRMYQPPPSGPQVPNGDRHSPTNHVNPYQPPLSARRDPRMWGLGQKLGVGAVPTTCACTNLPHLASPKARRRSALA